MTRRRHLFAAVTYSDVITIAAALLAVKDPATWTAVADTLVPELDGSLRMTNRPADSATEPSPMTNDQDAACQSI